MLRALATATPVALGAPYHALAHFARCLLPPSAGLQLLWVPGGERGAGVGGGRAGAAGATAGAAPQLTAVPILLTAQPVGRRGTLSLEATFDGVVGGTAGSGSGSSSSRYSSSSSSSDSAVQVVAPGQLLWDCDVGELGGVHVGAPWASRNPVAPVVEALAEEVSAMGGAYPEWEAAGGEEGGGSSSSSGAGGGGALPKALQEGSQSPYQRLLRTQTRAAGRVLCLDDFGGSTQRVLVEREGGDGSSIAAALAAVSALLGAVW